MPQFAVHRNPNAKSRSSIPFLLDVQSELLADLTTRAVVPLCLASTIKGAPIKTLMPIFEIEGQRYAMLTPQLAGIPLKMLGAEVADLSLYRTEIVAALDLLITGI